jgi:hypothetical protein
MNAPQVFTINPTQYAALVAKAQAAGIPIVGDSGQASKFGVQVQWHYIDPTLTIQVTNTPFFISPESVESDISTLVTETVGS